MIRLVSHLTCFCLERWTTLYPLMNVRVKHCTCVSLLVCMSGSQIEALRVCTKRLTFGLLHSGWKLEVVQSAPLPRGQPVQEAIV